MTDQRPTDEANTDAIDTRVRIYLDGLASGYATALAEHGHADGPNGLEHGASIARSVYYDPIARNAIADHVAIYGGTADENRERPAHLSIPVQVACDHEGDHQ